MPSVLTAQTKPPSGPWTLHADSIDPQHYFGETVANGMIGLVSAPVPFRLKETVLNGVFDVYTPGDVSSILRTFNLATMSLAIDGTPVGERGDYTKFRQALDLRHANLTTSFDVGDKASVRYQVYALRQAPYSAFIDVTITAKQSITITPGTVIDAPAPLSDVRYVYRPNGAEERLTFLSASARSPSGKLLIAASHTFVFDEPRGHTPVVSQDTTRRDHRTLVFTRHVPAGGSYHFAIVASTISSVQTADPLNDAERLTTFAALQGHDRLVRMHERAWDELWKSDIIVAGDDSTQHDIRAMLYHLYSFAREGTAYSLSPMGLSGSGYNGHAFWDTELWMLPVFTMLQPRMAESILEYRVQRLDAARRNASAHGFAGAMFPWESAATGDEDTPLCCLSGVQEHHITGDIAMAAWGYFGATQDTAWLHDRGYPILRATADFWASRVDRNGPGRYDIAGVMPADEWVANVDNNAFTNAVARANLAAAGDAARVLGVASNPDWKHVRANIPIARFPDGVTKEYDSYTGGRVKQADANLLSYPLHEVNTPAAIRRDLEYYEPRMGDGPAMTYSIFSILHERLGDPERAYAALKRGYRPNMRPPFGVFAETVNGDNPYFATGAGGILQAMINGFGGLEITPAGIVQHPSKLPAHWTSLTITGVGASHRTYVVRATK